MYDVFQLALEKEFESLLFGIGKHLTPSVYTFMLQLQLYDDSDAAKVSPYGLTNSLFFQTRGTLAQIKQESALLPAQVLEIEKFENAVIRYCKATGVRGCSFHGFC